MLAPDREVLLERREASRSATRDRGARGARPGAGPSGRTPRPRSADAGAAAAAVRAAAEPPPAPRSARPRARSRRPPRGEDRVERLVEAVALVARLDAEALNTGPEAATDAEQQRGRSRAGRASPSPRRRRADRGSSISSDVVRVARARARGDRARARRPATTSRRAAGGPRAARSSRSRAVGPLGDVDRLAPRQRRRVRRARGRAQRRAHQRGRMRTDEVRQHDLERIDARVERAREDPRADRACGRAAPCGWGCAISGFARAFAGSSSPIASRRLRPSEPFVASSAAIAMPIGERRRATSREPSRAAKPSSSRRRPAVRGRAGAARAPARSDFARNSRRQLLREAEVEQHEARRSARRADCPGAGRPGRSRAPAPARTKPRRACASPRGRRRRRRRGVARSVILMPSMNSITSTRRVVNSRITCGTWMSSRDAKIRAARSAWLASERKSSSRGT